jgi:hypothetical protein
MQDIKKSADPLSRKETIMAIRESIEQIDASIKQRQKSFEQALTIVNAELNVLLEKVIEEKLHLEFIKKNYDIKQDIEQAIQESIKHSAAPQAQASIEHATAPQEIQSSIKQDLATANNKLKILLKEVLKIRVEVIEHIIEKYAANILNAKQIRIFAKKSNVKELVYIAEYYEQVDMQRQNDAIQLAQHINAFQHTLRTNINFISSLEKNLKFTANQTSVECSRIMDQTTNILPLLQDDIENFTDYYYGFIYENVSDALRELIKINCSRSLGFWGYINYKLNHRNTQQAHDDSFLPEDDTELRTENNSAQQNDTKPSTENNSAQENYTRANNASPRKLKIE